MIRHYLSFKEDLMLKAILFDLDGTLVNTNQLIFNSFQKAFKELLKENTLSNEEIINCIGPTLEQTGEKYYPQDPNAFVEYYRHYYQMNHDDMIEIFPGIIEMLENLKQLQLKLVIVTSKKRDMTIKALKYLNIYDYFDLIVSSDDVRCPKPHPEPIETVMNYYGLTRDECLMVGDNSHDIECAHAAGVKSVAVGWAMRGADYLKKYHPTYIINEANDLLTVIKKEGS